MRLVDSKTSGGGLSGLLVTVSDRRYPRFMVQWVDTHCHLQLDARPPSLLLERAPDVRHVVVPGVDLASSREARRLVSLHPERVRFSAGLHPHYSERWPEQRDDLIDLMGEASAIGETGLDYYRDLSPRDTQMESFVSHHRIATELGKPLIVHCRDAFRQVYEVLDQRGAGPWVVLHCWTGGPKWSKRFREMDVTFSFAGPVTYDTGDTVRRGVRVIPPESALVETDTPYLTPSPYRGEPNEPARVALVGQALARVWGMDIEQVARLTTDRASMLFDL